MADNVIARWFAAKDPRRTALKRAVRAAVVIPINFAIGSELVGNPQVATLAAFGSFALLLFVEFPGNRASRAAAYGMVAITGFVFVTLGTLVSRPAWLAVTAMAVVGFLVLYAGVISSIIALAGRAVLLTFILPVMLPSGPHAIAPRLEGWAIACAVAIPAALFIWPPQDQNQLRVRAAAMCHALAHALAFDPAATDHPATELPKSVADLRAAFRASASRPVALSTGSRLLMRLVDELEWLATTVGNLDADAEAPATRSESAQALRLAATEVLHSCAYVLEHDGRGPDRKKCAQLDAQIEELAKTRRTVSEDTLAELRTASNAGQNTAGEFDRPLYAAHELGYLVDRTARTVSVIAAADSRTWIERLVGRSVSADVLNEASAAERIAVDNFDRRSVPLQSAIRGAAGLAVAVLFARITNQQEGFWIVLGALSVLRSNALSTGATALRAVGGTAVGFVIGGLLVAAIGTNLTVLWILLPIAILFAAFTPETISFAAGQAAFTVVVIILFNIIAPNGWRIGILRIEDVALGCFASILAGALFWPRGAGATLGTAVADAYWAGADHVRNAIDYVTGRSTESPDMQGPAKSSGLRMDTAFRQYLAERGAKNVPLESLTALANGATRLRLAGDAIAQLNSIGTADRLDQPVDLLVDQTGHITDWYRTIGDILAGGHSAVPKVDSVAANGSFLDVILPAIHGCGDPTRADMAERLLWSGQYVGDVNRMRVELVNPVGMVREIRQRAAWLR